MLVNFSSFDIIPFKVGFKAKPEYKQIFNQSLCSLTISVGQKVHENSRFLSTLFEVNRNFKECIIAVCDTLQRHTLNIDYGSSSSGLYHIAEQQGKNWLARNKSAINLLTIPYKIIRWDEWFASSEYQAKRAVIDVLYESDNDYKLCLNKAIEFFLERYKLRTPTLNYEQAFACSLEYLKEECAVMLIWADLGINFEIYPSKRNLAMAATYNKLIAPVYKNIMIPIALDIRSKKNQRINKNYFKETILT